MNFKPLIGAVLVGAVAWAANASATNLNVAFYNPNMPGTDSYVVDLGVSFADVASGANTGFSTNVIDTVLADTGVNLGSLGTFEYSVFALGTVFVPEFGGFNQNAVITGSANPSFIIPTDTALNSVFNNATTFLNSQTFQDSTAISSPGTPGFYEALSFNGNFGNTVLSAETIVGMPLTALLPEYEGDFNDFLFNFALLDLGDFLLSEDGTFTYSTDVVTVVPVPAAVWLFGTALLGGMARFGRRRKVLAA
jgi:hypothetical protein